MKCVNLSKIEILAEKSLEMESLNEQGATWGLSGLTRDKILHRQKERDDVPQVICLFNGHSHNVTPLCEM